MENQNILVSRASTTVSSIIGNVVSVVKRHIEGNFPKEYFRRVYITTAHTPSQQNENPDNVYKPDLPNLSIRPNFEVQSEHSFQHLPYWYYTHNYIFQNKLRNYRGVLYDEENEFYIYSVPDRIKLSFEVKIKVESLMRQMDTLSYIKQTFNTQGHYFLNAIPIEVEVPKTFIKVLMDEYGVDPNNPSDLNEFNNYLKIYSSNYITSKKNLSTGKISYMYKYPANILCRMEPPTGDADTKNMSGDNFIVSLNLTMELWTPASFILETGRDLDGDACTNLPMEINDSSIVFNFCLKTEPPYTIKDKSLLLWSGYITDTNVDVDRLDMSDMFSQEKIKSIIDYNNKYEIDNFDIFDIIVFRDNLQLKYNDDYTFNWNTLELLTKNPFFNHTHHVGLYGNLKKIQEHQKEAKFKNSLTLGDNFKITILD